MVGTQHGSGGDATKRSPFTSEQLVKFGASLAAILLVLLVVLVWTVLAYILVWPSSVERKFLSGACANGWGSGVTAVPWQGCDTLGGRWNKVSATWLAWLAGLAFLAVCIARSPVFLNLSSLANFYAGRLRRAYLGAGNPARLRPETAVGHRHRLDVREVDDDILVADYYPAEPTIAPLHLINITLNETRGGNGSAIIQRDRRGRNLVVSAAGITCDADTSGLLYRIPFDEEGHEQLPLATWVAISGAAVSTGMGSRNGFPLSTLAGLANMRLGYWWRTRQGWMGKPTQWDLLREFRADFSGPAERYWYLSDGGHFENTGAYELVRRRVPFIVVSDNGMDKRFEYEDIANLVRKVRIDFDCEIEFVDAATLNTLLGPSGGLRDSFGTLNQITGQFPATDRVVAALARLAYGDGSLGTMVLIKPRLTGDGPADLIRYKAANEAFPQQTTLDQFFDEAQWESYYHLGRLIARALFGSTAPVHSPPGLSPWTPAEMKPVP
jgi:hypothetical protein